MTTTTQTQPSFTTTIGAEAWARDKYEGTFPVDTTVTVMTRKGLVNKTYRINRKPTASDLLPVGVLLK